MSWAIWITGLPGSGKSTLARAVAAACEAEGVSVKVLELDEIRKVVTPEPTYTDAEREIVYRALAYMAKLLTEGGTPVIIDATGHQRVWRELARSLIPLFAEVQFLCPVEMCRERERSRPWGAAPPGIYARAGVPGATVPGVDVPYEPSVRAEKVINTAETDSREAVEEVLRLVRRLDRMAMVGHRRGEKAWGIPVSGEGG